jgi:hypothetical protein
MNLIRHRREENVLVKEVICKEQKEKRELFWYSKISQIV